MPTDAPTARLVLEDGTILRGLAFGAADATLAGEVVFNTAMTGYQEALTDPSYAGQILVMTVAEVGNYGVSEADVESGRPQVTGFVVRERSRIVSNHRATGALGDWLAAHGVPGIEGVDTRALVRHLRTAGTMRGVLSTDASLDDAALLERARTSPEMSGRNLAAERSGDRPASFEEDLGGWWEPPATAADGARPLRVVAIDCGAKRNIYRHLVERGCLVIPVGHDATAESIRALGADGLFISNGPGDPAAVAETIELLRELIGELPAFGICLGHQLLALAIGARTYKLPFGHRGANQPVRDLETGRVEITSQNHGFCVDPGSLEAAGGTITHVHLNDGTVAGFRDDARRIQSVQYHPEASPGPHDSAYLFDRFVAAMRAGAPVG